MSEPQNSPTDSNVGVELPWDHEPCPRDGCDGELQQQDDYNVMCLECEEVFVWVRGDTGHHLVDENNKKASEKRPLVTDGGVDRDDAGQGRPQVAVLLYQIQDAESLEEAKKDADAALDAYRAELQRRADTLDSEVSEDV